MIHWYNQNIEPALTFDDVQIVPGSSDVMSRSDVDLTTKFTRNHSIQIPLIAAPMDTVCAGDMACAMWDAGGVGIIHRFNTIVEQCLQVATLRDHIETKNFPGFGYGKDTGIEGEILCAAVGATGDYLERAKALESGGVNVIVIDVAHGNTQHVLEAVNALRLTLDASTDIVVGNIATGADARVLLELGVDALRVGIGGGSVCETRIRTGVGIPQLSSISSVSFAVGNRSHQTPIISCGGIRYPGDVAKAIAAGANSVIIGSLFAGTEEAPGEIFITGHWPNRTSSKIYRGAASDTAKLQLHGNTQHTEGNATMVPCVGSVKWIINDITNGLRSAMSYVGASNLDEFQEQAEFIRVTPAGAIEAHPHLL